MPFFPFGPRRFDEVHSQHSGLDRLLLAASGSRPRTRGVALPAACDLRRGVFLVHGASVRTSSGRRLHDLGLCRRIEVEPTTRRSPPGHRPRRGRPVAYDPARSPTAALQDVFWGTSIRRPETAVLRPRHAVPPGDLLPRRSAEVARRRTQALHRAVRPDRGPIATQIVPLTNFYPAEDTTRTSTRKIRFATNVPVRLRPGRPARGLWGELRALARRLSRQVQGRLTSPRWQVVQLTAGFSLSSPWSRPGTSH